MDLESLGLTGSDYLGIVVGGLAYFALGALWYTLLFRQRWMDATGRTQEEFDNLQGASPALFLVTLIGAIVATGVIAIVYRWGGGDGVVDGLAVGAIVGVGVAAMEGLKSAVYNFDDRAHAWTLYAINTAYAVLGLLLAGAIYSLIA